MEFNYSGTYDKLYKAGYHADLEYSHAKELCAWLRENAQFQSILDIGCSHGWVLRHFADRTAEGVDVSFEAVKRCRDRGLNAWRCAAHELDRCYPEKSVDVVISTDCFEHIHPDHAEQAIKQACRVAQKYIAMKIAPRPDVARWKELAGHPLHLTVKPIEWWRDQFLWFGGGTLIHTQADDTFVISYVQNET